jgi:hypothetical protein
MDHLFTLNELTPKIKCSPQSGGIDPSIIFGLDSKLFAASASEKEKAAWTASNHHDEVETVTVRRWNIHNPNEGHIHDDTCGHAKALDIIIPTRHDAAPSLTTGTVSKALNSLNKETIYRVKGFLRLASSTEDSNCLPLIETYILNWAFGRFELIPVDGNSPSEEVGDVLLTVMGERGEVRTRAQHLADALGAATL